MKTYRVTIDNYGDTRWYNEDGDLHREEGPAYIGSKGTKYWYLNNVQYTEAEFYIKLEEVKFIDSFRTLAEKHGFVLIPDQNVKDKWNLRLAKDVKNKCL